MNLRKLIFGNPLESKLESHEKLKTTLGLAVFAADALSSTAYATEEILIALTSTVYAQQANLISLPVAISIGILMAIVVFSYRQVIRAYPEGGGAYTVSKMNLGKTSCLIAGASLLLDYVLTVAVSVSAGVAALTSTGLVPVSQRTLIAILFVIIMAFINLRGVKESGKVIAFPAYLFILVMLAMVVTGFVNGVTVAEGNLLASSSAQGLSSLALNTAFLLAFAKAFSHGCAALTGIEAISNGVTAFKEPSSKYANRTMMVMGLVLCILFIGITGLAFQLQILPSHTETVISQIAKAVFGESTAMYYLVQFTTMVILVLAANTSFAGFPRLASLLAYDGFLPRQLMTLGDRLVFSNGIIFLSLLSVILIWAYDSDTHALIPLYAVGVFLSFTLAQAGMVVHHLKNKGEQSNRGLMINGLGAFTTGFVTLLLAVEKFWEGAWIVLIAIPILIFVFTKINEHYTSIAKQLALKECRIGTHTIEHTVLVLVSSLNKCTIPALEYARTLTARVEAVHVKLNPESTERLQRIWEDLGCDIPLVVLESPYRSIVNPILEYIDEVEARYDNDLITVVVPEFVTKHAWHNLLHNQTAILLKTLLRFKRNKVVTTVRYNLEL